jgi:uncharacterized protein (TIGR02145 family)
MKKILLLIMCVPVVLSAQTVSNLEVGAGTVAFNVNWTVTAVPEGNVWVFVDYNKNGVMTRLPVTGGTVTGGGTLGKEVGNTDGMWVNGSGNFSGKVTLSFNSQIVGAISGACAYASGYPPKAEYTATGSIKFTGTPPFNLVLSSGTTTAYSDYNLLPGQALKSFTDKTGAPGKIPGTNQPQGSCTFTQTPLVGTFANFHNTAAYSSSTYVTLIDERDNKNYAVVKINNRWWMAQNLNYQGVAGTSSSLTWETNSNSPSTGTGSNTALIGHFWCPGGNSSTVSISTRSSCDVWGALYSWETAMSFDGKGAWRESPSTNCTGAANTDNCKVNHGRTSSGEGRGGRGICPPNWHVPTDFEWGVFFDAVESSGTVHQGTSGYGWLGSNAGKYSKSACTGTATDANPYWTDHTNRGTDTYGFRGLPAGNREYTGSNFATRGSFAWFWSSSVNSESASLARFFMYDHVTIRRDPGYRSYGFSVRCIRDN